MHSRMRHRVAEFLKVLNRAKPEQAEKERKTARYVETEIVLNLRYVRLTLQFPSTVDVHSDEHNVVDCIYDTKEYIDVFIILLSA